MASTESLTELQFLQSLSEHELTELVIVPLLESLKYSEIRKTHGPAERGKDIVFCQSDPLSGLRYQAAAVKCVQINGSASSTGSLSTVINQLRQSLTEPYTIPSTGVNEKIERVYFFTPYQIGPQATDSIRHNLLDLWPRIEFIDGPRLLRFLHNNVPDLLASFGNPETKYHYQLVTKFRAFAPLGNSVHMGKLRVHDLFIPPSISKVSPEAARLISFANPEGDDSSVVGYSDWIKSESHAIVLADVGSGKTTLMQRLVLDSFVHAHESNLAPLYVPLSRLLTTHASTTMDIVNSIVGFLEHEYGLLFDSWETLKDFPLRNRLLLLDGFDELSGNHSIVASALDCLAELSELKVFVTSRPSRIPEVKNFRFYRISHLKDNDISKFLSIWFDSRPERAMALSGQIRSSTSLSVLCRTPLMLTLYALLASASNESVDSLPTRRTEVYSKVMELLVGKWDDIREIKNNISADAKSQILELLAYSMQKKQRRIANWADLEMESRRVLRSRLDRSFAKSHVAAAADELIYRSSIIRFVDEDEKTIEYAHLSFQEYFAARRLTRIFDLRQIATLISEDWWKNVLRFYFGLCRSIDGIVNTLKSKRKTGMGIRFLEFLNEADYSSSESREAVFERVGEELLMTKSISDSELAVYCRLGDSVVIALESIVRSLTQAEDSNKQYQRTFLGWSPVSYCKILVNIGTPQAKVALGLLDTALGSMSTNELVEILNILLGSSASTQYVSLISKGARMLELSINQIVEINRLSTPSLLKNMALLSIAASSNPMFAGNKMADERNLIYKSIKSYEGKVAEGDERDRRRRQQRKGRQQNSVNDDTNADS